jgi:spore coat polysaccharide biosynthesis protein SpsF (cytidylyltransferase family)
MVGILITARLGSTRLQQKHLIEVNNIPFIQWLCNRFATAFEGEIKKDEAKIIIATSILSENKKFEEIFKGTSTIVYFGSDDNIPERLLQCALQNNVSKIISVDGDDILCSTEAAKKIVSILEINDIAHTTQLPLGMNVAGFKTQYLQHCMLTNASKKLETGWGKIFDENKNVSVPIGKHDYYHQIRMTLDYEDDAHFFKAVIGNLADEINTMSDEDLISIILKNKWNEMNEHLNQAYWDNFNQQKQLEN